jgi:uncharacterized protein (TIGR00369 family)
MVREPFPPTAPLLDLEALQALLVEQFPDFDTAPYRVDSVDSGGVRLRLSPRAYHLRPGGTVAGPALMTLADTSTYLAIVAVLGPAVEAVTGSLTIHFLRRPAAADLVAEARLLRLGRRSAVGEVRLFSDGDDNPVAVATVTYSISPSRNVER